MYEYIYMINIYKYIYIYIYIYIYMVYVHIYICIRSWPCMVQIKQKSITSKTLLSSATCQNLLTTHVMSIYAYTFACIHAHGWVRRLAAYIHTYIHTYIYIIYTRMYDTHNTKSWRKIEHQKSQCFHAAVMSNLDVVEFALCFYIVRLYICIMQKTHQTSCTKSLARGGLKRCSMFHLYKTQKLYTIESHCAQQQKRVHNTAIWTAAMIHYWPALEWLLLHGAVSEACQAFYQNATKWLAAITVLKVSLYLRAPCAYKSMPSLISTVVCSRELSPATNHDSKAQFAKRAWNSIADIKKNHAYGSTCTLRRKCTGTCVHRYCRHTHGWCTYTCAHIQQMHEYTSMAQFRTNLGISHFNRKTPLKYTYIHCACIHDVWTWCWYVLILIICKYDVDTCIFTRMYNT